MGGKHRTTGRGKGRGPATVVGYALNVALVGLVTLLAIPLMISVGGVEAWSAAAVGQSVGVIATVVIGYGWAISGPAMIAKAPPAKYVTVLTESSRTRLFLLVPTLTAGIAFCVLFAPDQQFLNTILGLLSTALLGLRLNWFLIGLSKPYTMLFAETLPRISATLAGLLLMDIHEDMSFALIGQIVGVLLGVTLTGLWAMKYVKPYSGLAHPAVPGIKESLLSHRYGMSAATVSALYSSGPLILIGFTAPAAVGTYAVLDRIIKQLFTAASPVVDALRGWVPRVDPNQQRKRAKLALLATGLGGGLAGMLLVAMGDQVVRWFSDSQIVPDRWTMAAFGLYFATSLFSMVLSQVVLISFDLVRDLLYTGLLSACTGLALVAVFSVLWGVPGVLLSLVCGHLVGITRNISALRKYLSSP